MRELSRDELKKLEFLTSVGVEVATIEPTETGLKKSIFDATQPVRAFLKRNNIHNYSEQKQGPNSKVTIRGEIITNNEITNSSVSLYRPQTKKGDPRIWFSGITNFCKPSDILAFFFFDSKFWIFNLTTTSINELSSSNSPFHEIISSYSYSQSNIAIELKGKLESIASKGFIKSPIEADTAIGRLLESELGIEMNSRKNPDYKGIEIKSYRSERNNRKNLFAQVPDWSLSQIKSSKEMLDRFGYPNDGLHRLYCTVNSQTYNSQGLKLRVDEADGYLVEFSKPNPKEKMLIWQMEQLNERLLDKHSETFWVEAEVERRSDGEWFRFKKVEHTRQPIVSQLIILLKSGHITLDHLIKEKGMSAVEKGPIFKLHANGLPLLFPPSKKYCLVDCPNE